MPHSFKQFLEELSREKAPGPSPTFLPFHILRAMELISKKPIGRNKLSEELKVGEGATRTLINRLKDHGIIEISKAGCVLTNKGSQFWKQFKAILKEKNEFEKSELTLADYNVAVLVKNRGHKVKSGVEQRDAAVIAGAKGATTMILKKGHLVMPAMSDDVTKDFPKTAKQIIKLLKPLENDVIIVGSAESPIKAEYGAYAAALTLLD